MLDEAQREFRRVADLRPDEPSARVLPWPDRPESGPLARGGGCAAACGGARRPPGQRVLHNLAFALEQLGRLPEAEAAYARGGLARRATTPGIMMGWGVAALKRNDSEVALNRLQRAGRALWRSAASRRPGTGPWRWRTACEGDAIGVHGDRARRRGRLSQQRASFATISRSCRNWAAIWPVRRCCSRTALAENPTLPQVSKNLGDLLYRAGRYDDAFEAYERAAKLSPDLGDDLYFKMGNIAYKRRDRERARACWKRVTELNPGHQLARANLDTLDATA